MRIKVGESIDVKIRVDVQYQCSSCGEENLCICSIADSVYTPTVMGINLDSNLSGTAQKSLQSKFDAILDQNNIHRFRTAGFNCSCSNCGNIEPWASVNYGRLESIQTIFAWISVLSIISFVFAISLEGSGLIWIPLLSITAVSYAIIYGITKYISKDYNKQIKLIAKLPPESIPIIFRHSAERYAEFNRKQSAKSYLSNISHSKNT